MQVSGFPEFRFLGRPSAKYNNFRFLFRIAFVVKTKKFFYSLCGLNIQRLNIKNIGH